jgi:hypothetical protein
MSFFPEFLASDRKQAFSVDPELFSLPLLW